ncbi:hypothetical protein Bbelb_184110 [Branchiostoma belcheri]|nr:hypothetical protein Bbelb_184110 [Branchiostoma belcheri]
MTNEGLQGGILKGETIKFGLTETACRPSLSPTTSDCPRRLFARGKVFCLGLSSPNTTGCQITGLVIERQFANKHWASLDPHDVVRILPKIQPGMTAKPASELTRRTLLPTGLQRVKECGPADQGSAAPAKTGSAGENLHCVSSGSSVKDNATRKFYSQVSNIQKEADCLHVLSSTHREHEEG